MELLIDYQRISNILYFTCKISSLEIENNEFLLNPDFKVTKILLDNKISDITYKIKTINHKKYYLYACNKFKNIEVSYQGRLSGYSNIYRYAKEHTIRDNILLRADEDLFVPIFYNQFPFYSWLQSITCRFIIKKTKDYSIIMANNLMNETDKEITYIGNDFNLVMGNKFVFNSERCYFYLLKENYSLIESIKYLFDNIHDYMNKTFYRVEFPPIQLIELNAFYGSFVRRYTLFITKQDLTDFYNLTHEYIHLGWNPKIIEEDINIRFFDEAFTNYLAYRFMVDNHLKTKEEILILWYQRFKTSVYYLSDTPCAIVDYGHLGKGDFSYSVGAIFLLKLEEILGYRCFDLFIKDILDTYQNKPISVTLFIKLLIKKFPDIKEFVDNNFYTTKLFDEVLKKTRFLK